MISWARITTSTTCSNAPMSMVPSAARNFMRFSDARLHAESSTCRYSLQGLDVEMRPEFGQVCQSWMVVSYCTPGSAQRQAASAIWLSTSRAPTRSITEPSVRAVSSHSSPRSARSMNSSLSRTELFAFWYWIDVKCSESSRMSKPASRNAAAFSSSRALHQMKSRMSGWSTSSTTIFAPGRDRTCNAADHLLDGALALGRVEPAAEVLLGDDVGRVLRPALRELDALLLERRLLGIADQRVADLPLDGVERAHSRLRKAPPHIDPIT